MKMIQSALSEGRTTLTEYESKQVLASYGIPVTREILAGERNDFIAAVREIGFPLVLKGCAPNITHKTEQGMVRVDVRTEAEALAAYEDLTASIGTGDGSILVQEMIHGKRELMVGLTRDAQFGPCVMFGLGGIFTEILKDVSFRVAPLQLKDATDMMNEIRGRKILEAIRGMEAVDRDSLASILVTMGRIGLDNDPIKEIDVNPLIVREGKPVAVDALVVLTGDG